MALITISAIIKALLLKVKLAAVGGRAKVFECLHRARRTALRARARVVPGTDEISCENSESFGTTLSAGGVSGFRAKKSALEKADCLVLLEAMSASLPVITTSWLGVP